MSTAGVRWCAVCACAIAVVGVVPGSARADGMAAPPPLPPGFVMVADDGLPDRDYVPAEECVRSSSAAAVLDHEPWGQDRLRFTELAAFATGKGQKVAVIDTGVAAHAYLGDRLEGGGDYVVRGGDGLADCDGHGTAVAGIIAADPGADPVGFRGIAPDARIVSIRQSSAHYEYVDDTGARRGAGSLTTLAKAVIRAADTDGVTVVNVSINTCRPSGDGPIRPAEQQLQAALRYAVEDRDVVVVASAGNIDEGGCPEQNGPDPRDPTQIVLPSWFSDHVLSVAAMTEDGVPADFSVRGPWVSVAAPGTDIVSLDPVDPGRLANKVHDAQGKAAPIQGTSFAAPYVAGLVALVREEFPDLTARQVMNRVTTTAAHPATGGGHDSLVGHGMINPVAALTAFIPSEHGIPADGTTSVPVELPPPHESDRGPERVALIGATGGVGLLLLTLFTVHTVHTVRRNRDAAR